MDHFNLTISSIKARLRLPSQLYPPLDPKRKQFRLLTLHPGRPHRPLRCSLNIAEFREDHTPEYETCSYVWGDPSKQDEIIVNGHKTQIPVSSTVFLRRLRSEDKPRNCWIDSVCINQQNDKERSQQVALMGDIYRGGTRNLVYWCGEEDYVKEALDSVESLLNDEGVQKWLDDPYNHDDWSLKAEPTVTVDCNFNAHALMQLLGTQWLKRVWTFQEAYLAKENICYCGSKTVSLKKITAIACWLHMHDGCILSTDDQSIPDPLDYSFVNGSILHQATELSSKSPMQKFYSWAVAAMPDRKCSLPVDKVYGLLGIMSDTGIRPDYGRDVAEVYQQFTKAIIRHDRGLGILLYSSYSSRSALPSWVPDLNHSTDHHTDTFELGRFFYAGWPYEGTIFHTSETSEPSIIALKGFPLGSVKKTIISPAWPAWPGYPDPAIPFNEFESLVMEALGPHSKPETLESALAFTLCASRQFDGLPATRDIVESYRIWRNHLNNKISNIRVATLNQAHHPKDQLLASWYSMAVHVATHQRNMFTTSNGYIGLCPRETQENDCAVVLYGLGWPAILRPKGDRWIFVGIAYIYGVMFGEAVTIQRDCGADDTIFEIE